MSDGTWKPKLRECGLDRVRCHIGLRPQPVRAEVQGRPCPFPAYIFEIVVPPKFVTQMLFPSNTGFAGSLPTVNVLRVAPLLAFNFVTVAPLKSVTHIFDPSYAIPFGPLPAANVPNTVPDSDSLVTLL